MPREAAQIARLLGERMPQLVEDLLPAGHREGHEWRCGSVAGEPGKSLTVHLSGPKAGIWSDFALGDAGDALDLVRAVLRLDLGDALGWARRWLGLSDDERVPRRPAPPPRSRPSKSRKADAAAQQARALDIWRDAVEDIGGTPAETYLRSRLLDPAQLCSLHGPGRWPATLRYSERAALDPDRQCRALVVAVHGADCGLVRAIQRVLLRPDGSAVRDEKEHRTKLSLGPIRGNAAMFDYWPDPQERWGLAEGPETALAACALTGIPTWAALSAGNMRSVAPPSWAQHATIFADRDTVGLSAAAEAAHRLRTHPRIQSARVLAAPVEGLDVADMLAGGSNV